MLLLTDSFAGELFVAMAMSVAVFIQRLFTSYLPPIRGWITLVWLRKREYL